MIGIYCILNLVNDKIYIGQSVDIERRLRSHISHLINSKHHNQYLQRAFDKYGFDNFIKEKIAEGWTQQQLGDYVGLARQTVQDYLMVRGTSWSELKEVI